jgi:hypothetical protein
MRRNTNKGNIDATTGICVHKCVRCVRVWEVVIGIINEGEMCV